MMFKKFIKISEFIKKNNICGTFYFINSNKDDIIYITNKRVASCEMDEVESYLGYDLTDGEHINELILEPSTKLKCIQMDICDTNILLIGNDFF